MTRFNDRDTLEPVEFVRETKQTLVAQWDPDATCGFHDLPPNALLTFTDPCTHEMRTVGAVLYDARCKHDGSVAFRSRLVSIDNGDAVLKHNVCMENASLFIDSTTPNLTTTFPIGNNLFQVQITDNGTRATFTNNNTEATVDSADGLGGTTPFTLFRDMKGPTVIGPWSVRWFGLIPDDTFVFQLVFQDQTAHEITVKKTLSGAGIVATIGPSTVPSPLSVTQVSSKTFSNQGFGFTIAVGNNSVFGVQSLQITIPEGQFDIPYVFTKAETQTTGGGGTVTVKPWFDTATTVDVTICTVPETFGFNVSYDKTTGIANVT